MRQSNRSLGEFARSRPVVDMFRAESALDLGGKALLALRAPCMDSADMARVGTRPSRQILAICFDCNQSFLSGHFMAIVGVVDFVSSREIRGWAFHEEAPDEHLTIEVALSPTPIGQTVANIPREDLAPAGLGAGDHAFEVVIDTPITAETWRRMVVVAISENGGAAELAMDAALEPSGAGFGMALFAEDAALFPPVGVIADFVDEAGIAARKDWTGKETIEIVAAMQGDPWPIPHPDNRENYAPDSTLDYWLSGYGDFLRLAALAARNGVSGGDLLDFGGSTGRVFRHFALQSQRWRVWSCDFKRSSFAFNIEHFPSSLRVFLNTSVPSLPIPDSSFDLILACSVFTHIDDAESAWLLELRRVLRIGGVALISTHNHATWRKMTPSLRQTVESFRPDLAAAPDLPSERVVVRLRSDGDPYSCNVFHADAYVRRNWGRYFDIVAIEPLSLGEQAIVVCRRSD
jgi:SAM-dependent methyltransferase